MQFTAYTDDNEAGDKDLHGGKGAGLIDMTQAGLNVPPALIITTDAWYHWREKKTLPPEVKSQVTNILLTYPSSMFSVRSGAPVSMPGMMDTLLNVGVDADLDKLYPNAFRRFASGWLSIVKGVGDERIKELFSLADERVGATGNARWFKLISAVVASNEHIAIPTDRVDQVMASVEAVFKSWDTPRAKAYRALNNISDQMGTACVVQRMVMGTAPGMSGSGVMFTRDPATGEHVMKGEIAFQAQGEEVVSGEVTPMDLSALKGTGDNDDEELYQSLRKLCFNLEDHFGDVQDIEFTVEDGEVFVLQHRVAKMTPRARIKTACDIAKMLPAADERLAYLKERVTRALVQQTRITTVATTQTPLVQGLAASPGVISGKIVFRDTPLSQVDKGCILVAEETKPEDFPVMAKCGGILTQTGGFTCHSAVVARGMSLPAVVGCDQITSIKKGSLQMGGGLFVAGDTLTIDGTNGDVYNGYHEVQKMQPPRDIYEALHQYLTDCKYTIPHTAYYLDCGLGDRVCLPIDPSDMELVKTQLERAASLKLKGKTVAFGFEMQGMGEDLLETGPEHMIANMAVEIDKELAYETTEFSIGKIIYGVPKDLEVKVAYMLKCEVTSHHVDVLDLLDLLD